MIKMIAPVLKKYGYFCLAALPAGGLALVAYWYWRKRRDEEFLTLLRLAGF